VRIAQLPNVVLIEFSDEVNSYLCPGVQPRTGGFGEYGGVGYGLADVTTSLDALRTRGYSARW
jgi:hypothetical protein